MRLETSASTVVMSCKCLLDMANAKRFKWDVGISLYVIGANLTHTSVWSAVGVRGENLGISEFLKRHFAILQTATRNYYRESPYAI